MAHAEAEETHVYPTLRKKHAIGEDEEHHGHEEHAEGNERLLAVLEFTETESEEFTEAVEELARVINHHLTEEELTILNPAREDVSDEVRAELGLAFAGERNSQIDGECGKISNVRRIVKEAGAEGLLDAEE